MTLTEFVLARVAEDEADALAADGNGFTAIFATGGRKRHVDRWTPARVLAECAAKRRIVAEHSGSASWCGYTPGGLGSHEDMGFGPDPMPMDCDTMRHLAAPYSDHPDYREEWVWQSYEEEDAWEREWKP